jgi:hypothetical protein
MKNLKLVAGWALGIAFFILGCSKGTTGPAGPAGPAGPDSVIHSAWIPLNTPLNATDSFYEQNISAPSLTQSVLDSGMVIGYLGGLDNGGNTNVVPADLYVTETFTVGNILIQSLVDYTGSGVNYRYILIKGTIADQLGKLYTKQEIRTMSYQTLMKLLGVPGKAGSN